MVHLQEDCCTYNCVREDEPSGSKHTEDIVKFKTLVSKR